MKDSNRGTSGYFIITLLFPIAGLVLSLANWRKAWAKNIFWLACIYMGAVQIFQPEGTVLGAGMDAGHYVMELIEMHNGVHSFSEVASTFFDGRTNDIFQPTLTFLVSRFTDNGHVLFFFLAIIFGFFYSRNVWYVLDKLPNKIPSGIWLIIAYLFLVCPIWQINGFRMWTALHIFIYGALPFALEGKKDKLVWSFLSVLVHSSFIIVIAILGIYLLLAKPVKRSSWVLTALFIFYIISLTIKTINITAIADLLGNYLPDYYDYKVGAYMSDEALEARQDASARQSAYIGILSNMKYWAIQAFIILSYINILRNKNIAKWLIPLFSCALLYYSFANIASLVPSGGRFSSVAQMLMVPVFLLNFTHYPIIKEKWLLDSALLFLAIALLFDIRQGLDFYGITLIMGNFITMFFFESNIPLMNFIKQII